MSDLHQRDFSDMEDLPRRMRDFESHLEAEPCTTNGDCEFHSNSLRMCVACRLKLAFFHTVYNAEAYWERPA